MAGTGQKSGALAWSEKPQTTRDAAIAKHFFRICSKNLPFMNGFVMALQNLTFTFDE
ncbi:hypothetical protein LCL97_18350 [Seohaeicola saemankumensis]|nr:hypothetical protein [Seohaeicola saemankumensis]MCA0872796.1 hypothetical protein [Seohaeicola saemankumensis]